MKTIAFLSALLLTSGAFAQNTFGDIVGTFTETDKKSGIPDVEVRTSRGDQLFRTRTDENGRFKISGVPAGTYTITFYYNEDTIVANRQATVYPDGMDNIGIVASNEIKEVVITQPILRLKQGVAPEVVLGKKDIKFMPTKFDIKAMVGTMTTDVQVSETGGISFRGAREGDMVNYIDGVKMNEIQNVPSSAIAYIKVYAGAIPAKYGDTTGGVVVTETLSYFDLLREWEARNK